MNYHQWKYKTKENHRSRRSFTKLVYDQEMEDAIKEIFWNEEMQQYVFAFLGAMKGIEQNGAYECRAVYWFDN